MQPAGQDDDEGPGLGIDPEAGAGEAGVAEAGRTEQAAARRALTRLDVPTQPPTLAGGVAPASIMVRTASGERIRRPFGPSPPSRSVWA